MGQIHSTDTDSHLEVMYIHDNVRYKQERDIPYFSLRRGCFCKSRLVRAHTVRMTGSMKEV